jgi:hypothetical protein
MQAGGTGLNLPISVQVGNKVGKGADTYSYLPIPQVHSATGCIGGCPTSGARITIHGKYFGCEPLLFAMTDGILCSGLTLLSTTALSCSLAEGTGSLLSVMVSRSGSRALFNKSAVVSYAKPSIDAVHGCSSLTGNFTSDCDRNGGVELTILGTNFGAEGAVVEVGGLSCTHARHHPDTPHTALFCILPHGHLQKVVAVFQETGAAPTKYGHVWYQPCEPGTIIQGDACVACPPGRSSSSVNSLACSSCHKGSYSDAFGQTECKFCDVGTYQPFPSQTSCLDCPVGEIEPARGAFLCMACEQGQYAHHQETCHPCPVNAFCQGTITANKGYVILRESNLSYWETFSCPEGYCLGGNKCAPHRTGLLCGACEDGFYPNGDKCSPCAYGEEILLVPVLLDTLIVLVLIKNSQKTSTHKGIRRGLIFYMQVVNMAFGSEVIGKVKSLLSFASMDPVESTSDTSESMCYKTADPLVAVWVQQLNLYICAAQMLLFFLLSGLKTLIKKKSLKTFKTSTWAASSSSLFLFSFMVNAKVSIHLMKCETIMGSWVLKQAPSVFCDSEEYRILVSFSILTAVLLVAYWWFIAFKMWRGKKYFPKPITKLTFIDKNAWSEEYGEEGAKYFARMRTLFLMYRPGCYYWESVMIARRLAVVFIVVMIDDRRTKFLLLSITFSLFLVLHAVMQPFTDATNANVKKESIPENSLAFKMIKHQNGYETLCSVSLLFLFLSSLTADEYAWLVWCQFAVIISTASTLAVPTVVIMFTKLKQKVVLKKQKRKLTKLLKQESKNSLGSTTKLEADEHGKNKMIDNFMEETENGAEKYTERSESKYDLVDWQNLKSPLKPNNLLGTFIQPDKLDKLDDDNRATQGNSKHQMHSPVTNLESPVTVFSGDIENRDDNATDLEKAGATGVLQEGKQDREIQEVSKKVLSCLFV